MKIIRAFFMCLSMFSGIPCPYRPWDEDARSLMTACLPIVGIVIGALWLLIAYLASMFFPETIAAVLIAFAPFVLSGLIHIDGFMDTSDALLSWRPTEERQKILKDVHCGSFSVAALVLLAFGMFASARDLLSNDIRPLLLIPIASRCLSAFCVTALKPIGHSQYAAFQKNMATPLAAIVMLVITLCAGAVWLGLPGLICVLATAAGYICAMAWAFHTLEGVSGDLAGFALCIGELCGLFAAALV